MKRYNASSILKNAKIDEKDFYRYLFVTGLNRFPEPTRRRKDNSTSNRWNYIYLSGRDGWVSADPRWALSDAAVARHVAGGETYGVRCKRSESCRWFDIDIDHAAGNRHDPRLMRLREYFDPAQYLVQERLSGNFSFLCRCFATHVETIHAYLGRLCAHLELESGLGILEFFPDWRRARRLPCGDHTVWLPSSTNPDQDQEVGKHQQLVAFSEWLDPVDCVAELMNLNQKSVNTPTKRPKTSHGAGSGDSASENAMRGKRARCVRSVDSVFSKLSTPGTRYSRETQMIQVCYSLALSESECYEKIRNWYQDGGTAGHSQEWDQQKNYTNVLCRLKRHVITFYAWLTERKVRPTLQVDSANLTHTDIEKILRVCDRELHFCEFTYDLLRYTKNRRQHQSHLYISDATFRSFANGRECQRKWIPRLITAGVIKRTGKRWSIGTRCRAWRINWNFGDGKETGGTFRQTLNKTRTTLQTLTNRFANVLQTISRWTIKRIQAVGTAKNIGKTRILHEDESANGSHSARRGCAAALHSAFDVRSDISAQNVCDDVAENDSG